MKYKVTGTIELNWENVVEAESVEEAIASGIEWACDGHGLGDPVEFPSGFDTEAVELDEEDEEED